MDNEACRRRPEIINVNSNNPVFYPLVLKQVNVVAIAIILMIHAKKICVPDVVKNLNVKVFNLMLRANETRHINWHETFKCIYRLDAIVCNNKQH